MELGNQLGLQNRYIHPSIHIRSRELEVYSHPHFAPQRTLMGNHILKHRWIRINTISPRLLEVIVVET